MTEWTFRTRHGLWSIRRVGHRFHPMLDGDSLGSNHTPQAALNDLLNNATFSTIGAIDTSQVG